MATINRSETATKQPAWFILKPKGRNLKAMDQQFSQRIQADCELYTRRTLDGEQAYIDPLIEPEVADVFLQALEATGLSLKKKIVVQLLTMDSSDVRIATNLAEKVTAQPTDPKTSLPNQGYTDAEIASARVTFMPKANLSVEFVNSTFNVECKRVTSATSVAGNRNRFVLGHTMVQFFIFSSYIELYAVGSVKFEDAWFSFCLPL